MGREGGGGGGGGGGCPLMISLIINSHHFYSKSFSKLKNVILLYCIVFIDYLSRDKRYTYT